MSSKPNFLVVSSKTVTWHLLLWLRYMTSINLILLCFICSWTESIFIWETSLSTKRREGREVGQCFWFNPFHPQGLPSSPLSSQLIDFPQLPLKCGERGPATRVQHLAITYWLTAHVSPWQQHTTANYIPVRSGWAIIGYSYGTTAGKSVFHIT